jgi:head-tail adaptor
MPLNAGKLNRVLTLQFATPMQSASGEETLDWSRTETVMGQWLPAGTKEAWQAQQRLEGTIEGVFQVYWRDDIDPATTRIACEGKTYDIRPPIEIGLHEGLQIPVTAHA